MQLVPELTPEEIVDRVQMAIQAFQDIFHNVRRLSNTGVGLARIAGSS
jgi:hypothetical protein